MMNENHIITALVENKPGVLHKVSNMFRSRGFNISSLSVGPTEQPDLSRMTITFNGEESRAEQLSKQLAKLIDVVEVSRLTQKEAVYRELILIKVNATDAKVRSDIVNYTTIFRCHVIDVTEDSMTIELTGTPDKIDAFLDLVKSFGIKAIARTGITALARGVERSNEQSDRPAKAFDGMGS